MAWICDKGLGFERLIRNKAIFKCWGMIVSTVVSLHL